MGSAVVQSTENDGIANTERVDETATDRTVPPIAVLRYPKPADLFVGIPQLKQLISPIPQEDESMAAFFRRLRSSTTPEDAVALVAFAIRPKMAIWWGYECARSLSEDLPDGDTEIMRAVAAWMNYSSPENRWLAMQKGLFAPAATPAVHLALAVGWSGGAIAPNDRARVPIWRCPNAVIAAIQKCLYTAGPQRRSVTLASFLDLGESLLGEV